MGIYNPAGATSTAETYERMFFVSPTFSGTSPYFNTIQAAINACDGVNDTGVIVYEGAYTVAGANPVFTMKNHVHILGVNKALVKINPSNTTLGAVHCLPTGNWNVTLSGFTINMSNKNNQYGITTDNLSSKWTGAANKVLIQDVDVLVTTGTNQAGVYDDCDLANAGGSITVRNCTLQAQGANYYGYMHWDGRTYLDIQGGTLSGLHTGINGGAGYTQCTDTTFVGTVANATAVTLQVNKCKFANAQIINNSSNVTSVIQLFDCWFNMYDKTAIVMAGVNNDGKWYLQNCYFEDVSGLTNNPMIITGGDCIFRMERCTIWQSNIDLRHNNAGSTVVFIGNAWHSAPFANCIVVAAAQAAFVTDNNSDKAPVVAFAPSPGSVDNTYNIAI